MLDALGIVVHQLSWLVDRTAAERFLGSAGQPTDFDRAYRALRMEQAAVRFVASELEVVARQRVVGPEPGLPIRLRYALTGAHWLLDATPADLAEYLHRVHGLGDGVAPAGQDDADASVATGEAGRLCRGWMGRRNARSVGSPSAVCGGLPII